MGRNSGSGSEASRQMGSIGGGDKPGANAEGMPWCQVCPEVKIWSARRMRVPESSAVLYHGPVGKMISYHLTIIPSLGLHMLCPALLSTSEMLHCNAVIGIKGA